MRKFHKVSDLIDYMDAVFDTELNIYIQEQLLSKMNNTYHQLGNRKQINRPQSTETNYSIFDSMAPTGIVGGILSFIVAFIVYRVRHSGFFAFINSLWTGLVFGVIGMIVFGLTLGAFIGCVKRNKLQCELDEQFTANMRKYNKLVEIDNNRVAKENVQKERLCRDMSLVMSGLDASREALAKMYNYNYINPAYRNIYAVSSIYGYLQNGRTQSLEMNPETGDKGAYNIYEEERRLDAIVLNTEEILKQLDQVINNQYVLAEGLKKAEREIAYLNKGVNDFAHRTQNQLEDIQNSQELVAYHTDRIRAETGVLTWLAMVQ